MKIAEKLKKDFSKINKSIIYRDTLPSDSAFGVENLGVANKSFRRKKNDTSETTSSQVDFLDNIKDVVDKLDFISSKIDSIHTEIPHELLKKSNALKSDIIDFYYEVQKLIK